MLETATHDAMGTFLRDCRHRLHPETSILGWHQRLAHRIGKAVTQDEVAEAAGISRVWYAQLEAGSRQASSKLLARLADVLMLDAAARAKLFELAIPELNHASSDARATEMLQSLSWMHRCFNKLWIASSPTEVLSLAAEQIAERFPKSRFITASIRRDAGQWEYVNILGDERAREHDVEFWQAFTSMADLHEVDEGALFPVLAQPGDIGTMSAYEGTDVKSMIEDSMREHDLGKWRMLLSRVRSRNGIVGNLIVKDPPSHDYSNEELVALAALADVASLALE